MFFFIFILFTSKRQTQHMIWLNQSVAQQGHANELCFRNNLGWEGITWDNAVPTNRVKVVRWCQGVLGTDLKVMLGAWYEGIG